MDRCRAVDAVGGLGELRIVPELEAGALVLLNAEVLETRDIIGLHHLVHLDVDEQLIDVAFDCTAYGTDEVVAAIVALFAAGVMDTDYTVGGMKATRLIVNFARVWSLLRIWWRWCCK